MDSEMQEMRDTLFSALIDIGKEIKEIKNRVMKLEEYSYGTKEYKQGGNSENK